MTTTPPAASGRLREIATTEIPGWVVRMIIGVWLILALVMAYMLYVAPDTALDPETHGAISVVVRETPLSPGSAAAVVEKLGGTVLDSGSVEGGFIAEMPIGTVGTLRLHPAVEAVLFSSDAAIT